MRSKVKISFIANKSARRTRFRKRKKGMVKKLNELVTLCDVKAFAIFYGPQEPIPETWPPSREDFEEVVTKFNDLSFHQRTKKMVDQESYMLERITKGKEQVKTLCAENRDSQLREFMFDNLDGDLRNYHLEANDLQDLSNFAGRYIHELTQRIKFLNENGESSSSSFPPLLAGESSSFPPPLAGESSSFPPPVVEGAAAAVTSPAVTTPVGFYDHVRYQNMNMSYNQHEPVQYQTHDVSADAVPVSAPNGFCDHINMYVNQHEPVQYQNPTVVGDVIPLSAAVTSPIGFYDHIRYYDMNMSMNMNQNQHEPVQYQSPTVVGDVIPLSVEVTSPIGFYDHIQYYNMNMNQNPHEQVQYQTSDVVAGETTHAGADASTFPIGFCDHIRYYDMNMNQNENQNEQVQHQTSNVVAGATPHAGADEVTTLYHNMNLNQNQNQNQHEDELVQYQTSDFYDQIQQGIYHMNLNQDVSQNSNHQQTFMDMLMEHPQHMGYIGEHANIPSIDDDNHYHYHQVPTADFAAAGLMSTATTTVADHDYAPNINNNL